MQRKQQSTQTIITIAGTLCSRILGFIRDSLLAYMLGPSADIFLAAFRLPNLVRRLCSEGTLGMAHVALVSRFFPLHAKEEAKGIARQKRQGILFSYHVAIRAFLWAGFFCLFLALFATPIMAILAPGFDGQALEKATRYFRLCLAYLPLALAGAIVAATLNAAGRFAASSFSPVFLNIGIIALPCLATFTPVLFPSFFSTDLASFFCLGLVFGGCLQLVFLFLNIIRLLPKKQKRTAALLTQQKTTPHNKGNVEQALAASCTVKTPSPNQVLVAMAWTIPGGATQQAIMLIAYIAASFLASGSISAMYFAERLIELPLAVAGVAIANVALPNLATLAQNTRDKEFQRELGHNTLRILFLSLPAAAGLAGIALPLVALLFEQGNFHSQDVITTAEVLRILCLGIPGMCLSRIFIAAMAALDASQRAKKTAFFSLLFSACVTILCCVTLIPAFHIFGIAIAIVCGVWSQGLFLWVALYKKRNVRLWKMWGDTSGGTHSDTKSRTRGDTWGDAWGDTSGDTRGDTKKDAWENRENTTKKATEQKNVWSNGRVRAMSYILCAWLLFFLLDSCLSPAQGKLLIAFQLFGVIIACCVAWFGLFSLFPKGEASFFLHSFLRKGHEQQGKGSQKH